MSDEPDSRDIAPSIAFFIMLRRSTVIATNGLISHSAAAVSLGVNVQKETERIREYLSRRMGRDVEVKATVIRADVIEASALAAPES